MDRLPNQLLAHVFTFGTWSSYLSARSVAQQWHRVSRQSCASPYSVPLHHDVARFPSWFLDSVRPVRLTLRKSSSNALCELKHIASRLLHFECQFITTTSYSDVAISMPLLESFTMHCPRSLDCMIAVPISMRLQELRMPSLPCDIARILTIGTNAPHLHTLAIGVLRAQAESESRLPDESTLSTSPKTMTEALTQLIYLKELAFELEQQRPLDFIPSTMETLAVRVRTRSQRIRWPPRIERYCCARLPRACWPCLLTFKIDIGESFTAQQIETLARAAPRLSFLSRLGEQERDTIPVNLSQELSSLVKLELEFPAAPSTMETIHLPCLSTLILINADDQGPPLSSLEVTRRLPKRLPQLRELHLKGRFGALGAAEVTCRMRLPLWYPLLQVFCFPTACFHRVRASELQASEGEQSSARHASEDRWPAYKSMLNRWRQRAVSLQNVPTSLVYEVMRAPTYSLARTEATRCGTCVEHRLEKPYEVWETEQNVPRKTESAN